MSVQLPQSIFVGRSAIRMALTESREEELALREHLLTLGINSVGVDFGGEFLPMVRKIIERAVVASQRQGLVPSNHVGEGSVAGATKSILDEISPKAMGFNVGGKIGIARHGEHLTVAIYCSIGLLNLNQTTIAMAHRTVPTSTEGS